METNGPIPQLISKWMQQLLNLLRQTSQGEYSEAFSQWGQADSLFFLKAQQHTATMTYSNIEMAQLQNRTSSNHQVTKSLCSKVLGAHGSNCTQATFPNLMERLCRPLSSIIKQRRLLALTSPVNPQWL